MSKGDKDRTADGKAFRKNHSRIFSKPWCAICQEQINEGQGHAEWCLVNERERRLKDEEEKGDD